MGRERTADSCRKAQVANAPPAAAPTCPAPPRPARCLTARWCRLLKGSAYKKSKVPEQPLVYW
jgi:hypothetical protein